MEGKQNENLSNDNKDDVDHSKGKVQVGDVSDDAMVTSLDSSDWQKIDEKDVVQIEVPLKDAIVEEGMSATLSCRFLNPQGCGLWLKWSRDDECIENREISTDETIELHISQVNMNNHAGKYTCQLYDDQKKVSLAETSCILIVQTSATVEFDPENPMPITFKLYLGRKVKPSSVEWFLDDKLLNNIENLEPEIFKHEELAMVVIRSPSYKWCGIYKTELEINSTAIAASYFVKLKSQPIVLKEMNTIVVKEESPISLVCNFYSNPSFTVSWDKGSKKLNQQGEINKKHGIDPGSAKLDIPKISAQDAGEYFCKISDSGLETSARFVLIVKMIENVYKKNGERFEIHVKTGLPAYTPEWMFAKHETAQKKEISPKKGVHISSKDGDSVLEVDSIDSKWHGFVFCKGTNDINFEIKFPIEVELQPRILEAATDVTVIRQNDAILCWKIFLGYPNADVDFTGPREQKRYKKWSHVTDTNEVILTVKNTDFHDEGTYSIHASYKGGTYAVEDHIRLKVLEKPKIHIEKSNKINIPTKTRFSFTVHGKPFPDVSVLINLDQRNDITETCLSKSGTDRDQLQTSATFSIESVSADLAGEWVVKVENEAGIDQKEFILEVKQHIVILVVGSSEIDSKSFLEDKFNDRLKSHHSSSGLSITAVKYCAEGNTSKSSEKEAKKGKMENSARIMKDVIDYFTNESQRKAIMSDICDQLEKITSEHTKQHCDTTFSLVCVGAGAVFTYDTFINADSNQEAVKSEDCKGPRLPNNMTFKRMVTVGSVTDLEQKKIAKFVKAIIPIEMFHLETYVDNKIHNYGKGQSMLVLDGKNEESSPDNKIEGFLHEKIDFALMDKILQCLEMDEQPHEDKKPGDKETPEQPAQPPKPVMVTGFYRKRVLELTNLLGEQLDAPEHKQYFQQAPLVKSDDFEICYDNSNSNLVLLVATFTERMNLLMDRPDIGQVTEPYKRALAKEGNVFLVCVGMPKTYSFLDDQGYHKEIKPLFRSQPALSELIIKGHFISVTEGGKLNEKQCNLLNEWFSPIKIHPPKSSGQGLKQALLSKLPSFSFE